MKVWERPYLIWSRDGTYNASGPPLDTNILVSHWQPCDGERVCWQIAKLMITTHRLGDSRAVELMIGFRYDGNSFCCPEGEDKEEILRRLGCLLAGRSGISVSYQPPFLAYFELRSREEFAKACLQIAIDLFSSFGISDREAMAKFQSFRQSFISVGGEWVTFSNYLRKDAGLPLDDDDYERVALLF